MTDSIGWTVFILVLAAFSMYCGRRATQIVSDQLVPFEDRRAERRFWAFLQIAICLALLVNAVMLILEW